MNADNSLPTDDPRSQSDPEELNALPQNLIDDMLGMFPGEHQHASGLASLVSHNALPQFRSIALENAFERSSRMLESSLRRVALDSVQVNLSGIVTMRCHSFIEGIAIPALLAIVKTSWGGRLVIELSADFIYMLVDMTFGGSSKTSGSSIDGRPFTAIEMGVARRLVDDLIDTLEKCLNPIEPVTLQFEMFESIPRFVDVAPPPSIAIVARLAIQVVDVSTNILVMIPQTTLGPVQHLLSGQRLLEINDSDPSWEKHLKSQVMRSTTPLHARLAQKTISLRELVGLGVGETIMFDTSADEPVSLLCGDIVVAKAGMGRSRDRIAVKVLEVAPPPSLDQSE